MKNFQYFSNQQVQPKQMLSNQHQANYVQLKHQQQSHTNPRNPSKDSNRSHASRVSTHQSRQNHYDLPTGSTQMSNSNLAQYKQIPKHQGQWRGGPPSTLGTTKSRNAKVQLAATATGGNSKQIKAGSEMMFFTQDATNG
jgi:hypothetical protein